MQEVIPLMDIYNSIRVIMQCDKMQPTVKCTIFEDNNSVLELAKAPKMHPRRTKHVEISKRLSLNRW
jgi:hypothetical protein